MYISGTFSEWKTLPMVKRLIFIKFLRYFFYRIYILILKPVFNLVIEIIHIHNYNYSLLLIIFISGC